MTTITANSTVEITLNSPTFVNPVVNEAAIAVTAGIAMYGFPLAAWTIINQGIVDSTDSTPTSPTMGVQSAGIFLSANDSVINESGATIGGFDGIYSSGAITVDNAGTIAGDLSNPMANYFGTGVYVGNGSSVINQSTGTISGTDGIHGGNDGFNVDNAGSISGSVDGIRIFGSGSVTNHGTGVITGYFGISSVLGGVTVDNASAITGSVASIQGTGIALQAGGSITNERTATISGFNGIFNGSYGGVSGTVAVMNAGSIAGVGASGFGIDLRVAGSITNAASASIYGDGIGVKLSAGGTVTNAGTISGHGGSAVVFDGTNSNLLVLDPGFDFSGIVTGSTNGGNTLELASAASTGVVTGLGSEFAFFDSIVFDADAHWSIGGDPLALTSGQVISGFAVADTIDLVGVNETIGTFSSGTLSLTGSAPLDLLLPGSFTTAQFQAAPSSDGTDITLACFLEGTRILTEMGEVPVERLRVGMRVVSLLHHKLLPIVWIGQRRLRTTRDPRASSAWPVRLSADAFGSGAPHRDLWLSADHALFVRDVLVPVRCLINGTSIAWHHRDDVAYFHIEIAGHGVLLAEGLHAESYLDTGNRRAFANTRPAGDQLADFAQRHKSRPTGPRHRGGAAVVTSSPSTRQRFA